MFIHCLNEVNHRTIEGDELLGACGVGGGTAEEDEDFDFGLGLGVQVRTYTGALSQQGPYLGGGIEVMFTTTSYDAEEYSTTSLVPQVEAGFRWDYPTYIVGVGAFMGATVPISSTGYDIDEEGESIVAAGLMVDIGWYL